MQTTTSRPRTVLVLGATGGVGGTVARTLHARGWHVRAMGRDAEASARKHPAFTWVQGDAMVAADVHAAAAGVDAIVHAVNPPGYRDWDTLVLPMLDHTIAAARAHGARIVFPGSVYNYIPDELGDAATHVTEATPQRAATRKGAIRVEMERRLAAAAEAGTPVILVRAGDYFGPDAANNWFSGCLVAPGKPVTTIRNPGTPGVGHQWAYLPDVAETMARLLERADRLPTFAVYHLDGFYDRDGGELAAAIQRATIAATGRTPRIARFPWWLVPLGAPFVPFLREVREMRYLWTRALRMSNARLVAELGEEPHTPIDVAVATTLRALGCLAA